jgi:hypothetical protein
MCYSAYNLITFYLVIVLCISFISYTCYVSTISVLNLVIFSLLLKPTAQKEKMDWNSSTRSSRLCAALVAIPVVLWSLPLFRPVSQESQFSLLRYYLCNKYTLFVTFGYL